MGIAGCDIIVPCADEGSNTVSIYGEYGGEAESIDDESSQVRSTRMRTMGELSRLRRQFVSFTKSNPVHDSKRIASLFINFLNSSQ